jgi:uncharacterized membrane protein
MATMSVWNFNDAAGAARAKDTLAELQKEGLIQIVDAASGALRGPLDDVGIDEDFIKRTRDAIPPGTSAPFLLSQQAIVDKVAERVPRDGELIRTNLNSEEEQALCEVFAAG